jgi:hypothetical protein
MMALVSQRASRRSTHWPGKSANGAYPSRERLGVARRPAPLAASAEGPLSGALLKRATVPCGSEAPFSADRTADVQRPSDVDQGRKTVSDSFGEGSRSRGRSPMAAALWNR